MYSRFYPCHFIAITGITAIADEVYDAITFSSERGVAEKLRKEALPKNCDAAFEEAPNLFFAEGTCEPTK